MVINPIDREWLRERVEKAQPFPFFAIDEFLEPKFAERAHAAFPSFTQAAQMGRTFASVNERNKIQITDSAKFPPALLELHDALASREWLELVSYVMQIPNLLPDPELVGGGIHETGPRGHLDVHVDFNYIAKRDLHRRINILVYFNKNWRPEWGGEVELWDKDVRVCHHAFAPVFNRCVIFETSEISYHGVRAVKCPDGMSRKSFAGYYYTKEPPAHWTGESHSTLFRARPDEKIKGSLLMPAEKITNSVRRRLRTMTKRKAR